MVKKVDAVTRKKRRDTIVEFDWWTKYFVTKSEYITENDSSDEELQNALKNDPNGKKIIKIKIQLFIIFS